jgi:lipoprotein-anchoring transpeptidase ErfK/SrfK
MTRSASQPHQSARHGSGARSAPGLGLFRSRTRTGNPNSRDSSKQWQGRAEIDGKHVSPAWAPPDEVRRDNPRLPDVIPGGSPRNPMGPRALTLSGGEQYAIPGTNRPYSIGTFATFGCIRMFNEDIIDLFDRVNVGTEVIVMR